MGSLNCHQARHKPGRAAANQLHLRKGVVLAPPTKPLLVQLTPDVLFHVLWCLAGGLGDVRSFQAAMALRSAGRGLREALDQSPFWQRKVHCMLAPRSHPQLQLDFVEPCKGRRLCVTLLCAARLLQHVLSCDWIALHDVHVLLKGLGLTCEWSMVLLLRQLVAFSMDIFPPPSVHWLRDLLEGFVAPWERCSPPPLVKELEGFRDWLQRNVSEEIWSWRRLAETTAFYDDALSKKHQRKYASKAMQVAAWVLLVREFFVHNVGYGGPQVPGAQAISPRLKARLRGDRLSQTWVVPLLLVEPLRRQRTEVAEGWWNGLALTEDHTQDQRNTSINVGSSTVLRFPKLSLDRWWIHSQRGVASSAASSKWVQLDARLDASGIYSGQWVEEDLRWPLDSTVFTLAGGTSFLSMVSPEAPSKGLVEVFGLAAAQHEGDVVLRCFYLVRSEDALGSP
ncbi:unnamed protein product [Symbiodinium natans]|uniref:Uncharacterized protein n=1 Tax=Symbiodinium natans TaxID=878477 RepID=A0A812NL05_9DINO|nr:unnamed protein product [Symbiodinium natans]